MSWAAVLKEKMIKKSTVMFLIVPYHTERLLKKQFIFKNYLIKYVRNFIKKRINAGDEIDVIFAFSWRAFWVGVCCSPDFFSLYSLWI